MIPFPDGLVLCLPRIEANHIIRGDAGTRLWRMFGSLLEDLGVDDLIEPQELPGVLVSVLGHMDLRCVMHRGDSRTRGAGINDPSLIYMLRGARAFGASSDYLWIVVRSGRVTAEEAGRFAAPYCRTAGGSCRCGNSHPRRVMTMYPLNSGKRRVSSQIDELIESGDFAEDEFEWIWA